MFFAVVESEPKVLDFLVLYGIEKKRAYGRHAFTSKSVSIPVGKIVHFGMTAPSAILQFPPAWALANMSYRAEPLAVAANPKEEEDEDEDRDAEGLRKRNLGLPTHLRYQSGEDSWTIRGRSRRLTEAKHLQTALKRAETSGWRWAVQRPLVSGYELAGPEITRMRNLIHDPTGVDSFFYCMVFAMLTANEGTSKAEKNLAAFAPIIRSHGINISEREFKSGWGAGQADSKWKSYRDIRDAWPGLREILLSTRKMDRELRQEIAVEEAIPGGLGTIKFSFSLECMGQDVACLDRWMFRALGAAEKPRGYPTYPNTDGYVPQFDGQAKGPGRYLNIVNQRLPIHNSGAPLPPPPWKPFSEGAYVLAQWGIDKVGSKTDEGGISEAKLEEYKWWEDRLKKTVFYHKDDPAPNPLARAQWTMWESVLREHPKASIFIPYASHIPLIRALAVDPEKFDKKVEEWKKRAREAELLDLEFARRVTIKEFGPKEPRLTMMKKLRKIGGPELFAQALAWKRGEIRRKPALAVTALAEKHTEAELARLAEVPLRPPATLFPIRNPRGIGRVFSEALAWKRGEVRSASPEAKRLATQLAEGALERFASV